MRIPNLGSFVDQIAQIQTISHNSAIFLAERAENSQGFSVIFKGLSIASKVIGKTLSTPTTKPISSVLSKFFSDIEQGLVFDSDAANALSAKISEETGILVDSLVALSGRPNDGVLQARNDVILAGQNLAFTLRQAQLDDEAQHLDLLIDKVIDLSVIREAISEARENIPQEVLDLEAAFADTDGFDPVPPGIGDSGYLGEGLPDGGGIGIDGEAAPEVVTTDFGGLAGHDPSDAIPPIILDLTGDGFDYRLLDESVVTSDLNADGFVSRVAWIGPDDAILAIDMDGDGAVSGPDEFVFADLTEADDTDMEAFAALYDNNGDGIFDSNDAAFADAIVWRDLDQNGEFDAGEGQTLSEAQIESIGLVHGGSGAEELADGTVVHGVTTVVRTDQTTTSAADVALVASDLAFREELDGGVTFRASGGGTIRSFETGDDLDLDATVEGHLGLIGGTGFDRLSGGDLAGVLLDGAEGDDEVIGTAGDDLLAGGLGADTVSGGDGDDVLFLDAADFVGGSVDGGAGIDIAIVSVDQSEGGDPAAPLDVDLSQHGLEALVSGAGNDNLSVGADITGLLSGGAGDDSLSGDLGDDLLTGDDGADTVVGGEGENLILGGRGDDVLSAGSGDDSYLHFAGDGVDEITDAGGSDTLVMGGDVALHRVWLSLDGGDLTVGVAAPEAVVNGIGDLTEKVVIRDWNDTSGNPGSGRIEQLLLGDGSALSLPALVDAVGLLDGAGSISVGAFMAAQLSAGIEGQAFVGTGSDDDLFGSAADDQVSGLDGNDFLFGDAGDDALEGGDGDDSLAGSDGADTLSGGAGEDVLSGAEGMDLLEGGAGDDLYIFGRGDGRDALMDQNLVTEQQTQQGDAYTAYQDVQVWIDQGEGQGYWQTQQQAYTAYETITVDVDVAYDAGVEDALFLAGDIGIHDLLLRLNNGALEIALKDADNPTATFDELGDRITIQNWSDDYSKIEKLVFGDGSRLDLIPEVAALGLVDGGAAVDLIAAMTAAYSGTVDAGGGAYVGGSGDDALVGGDGNDILIGGAGNDALFGGEGNDDIFGGDGSDVLFGGDGADSVVGGDGDDLVEGGAGADTIDGGDGDDTLSYAGAEVDGQGVTVSLGSSWETTTGVTLPDGSSMVETLASGVYETTLSGGDAEGDVISNVENVIGSNGDDDITGNQDANGLAGGAGDDSLYGGDGADLLIGGTGDDVLDGGAGSKFDDLPSVVQTTVHDYQTNDGGDTLNGGEGNDSVSYAGSDTGVTVDLNTNTASSGTQSVLELDHYGNINGYIDIADGDAAGDVLIDIEGAIGSEFGDNLIGNSDANGFSGNGGNDVLDGQDGNDSLTGGAGADLLDGGNGNDVYDFTSGIELIVDEAFTTVTQSYVEDYVTGQLATQTTTVTNGEDQTTVTTTYVATSAATRTVSHTEQVRADAGHDVLRFGEGITAADLVFELVDRTVTTGAGSETVQDLVVALADPTQPQLVASQLPDRVVLQGFSIPEFRIDVLQFADGSTLTAGEVFGLLATSGADAMNWSGDGTVIDALDGNDTITTGDGADSLAGGAGDDEVSSGAGRDTLDGGAGSDQLNGGSGNDIYLFNAGDGADTLFDEGIEEQTTEIVEVRTGSTTETITVFDTDALVYVDYTYTNNWTQTETIEQTGLIEVDGGSDILRFGEGITEADLAFETVSRVVTISGVNVDIQDLVIGIKDDPASTAAASSFSDRITITEWFDASHRIETIEFSDGSSVNMGELESLLASDAADNITWANIAVNFDAGLGNDTLVGSSQGDTLRGSEGDDFLNGAGSGDELIGGVGDDTLIGDTGNDILEGGAGADSLVGGERFDQVSYRNALTAVSVNIAAGTAVGPTEAVGDVLVEIEGAIGTAFNDTLSGSAGGNRFDGLAGDDLISSGDGDDTLDGGAGADTLDAGDGDDLIAIDSDDFVVLGGVVSSAIFGGAGTDTIVATEDIGQVVDLGVLGAEHAVGSDTSDAFTAASTGSLIIGNAGDDTLVGHAGADTLLGSEGGDSLRGNDGDDILAGEAGEDTISGSGHNDTIFGGAGDDVLNGDGGADSLEGGFDNDSISGGNGDDTLRGEAGDDSLFGGQGDDFHFGADGNDSIDGGIGNDTVGGGNGADTLKGGDGDDTVNGGNGTDRITSGAGNDLLSGGLDADTFVFGNDSAATDIDRISDFLVGEDILQLLDGLSVSSLSETDTDGNTVNDATLLVLSNGSTVELLGVTAATEVDLGL